MPRGRRIADWFLDRAWSKPIDTSWMHEMFKKYDTRCEFPDCREPANHYLRNIRMFAFVCLDHELLHDEFPERVEKLLEQKLMEDMLKLSYYHQDLITGGSVSFKLAQDHEALKKEIAASTQAARRSTVRKEIAVQRRLEKENGIKPGVPDDDMLTARNIKLVKPKSKKTEEVPAAPIVIMTNFI